MKLQKYFAMLLLALSTVGMTSSCSDDEDLGEAPRLFRPVASLEAQNNSVLVTWDNIKGATEYTVKLYKITGTAEDGTDIGTLYREASCESSPYTFSDLEWDEKYGVVISCQGGNKVSEEYKTGSLSVPYATKLKSIKTIDNSARITWDDGGTQIRVIVATPAEVEGESVIREVSESEYEAGTVDVVGLQPETKYNFYTYSDVDDQSNSTYTGKLTSTTSKAIDFDSEYGAGNWVDIRDYPDDQAVDTLQTDEFWEQVSDGMTIILRGDFDYKVSSSVQFDRSVRFVTASTLGGNARFVSSGGLGLKKGVDVDWVEFVDVDFIGDKCLPGGGKEVATTTDKNFSARQVFNINGVKCTLGSLSFKGCHIEGYRAVVRAQADGDNITNVLLEECTINGVGDQGVFTTNNKKADWKNVTMKNCTVTNIVMLCDFRSVAGQLTLTVENCTFCYAPIETTANANTPLFRLSKNPVVLNVRNTLFGPSLFAEGKGGNITANKAGTVGSIFTDASAAQINVSTSFKTNFDWAVVSEKTYPLEGLQELSFDENALWSAPADGDFRITGNVGEDGIGSSQWF